MMLPVQYPMKSMADTVALLVKPPTLDVMRDNAMGISAAKIADNHIPARRVYLCSLLTVYTIIMPMRLRVTMAIMHMTRVFLTYVEVREMNARPLSWKTPPAIWTRRELRGENPNPLTIMLLNCISTRSARRILEELMVRTY
jgi:hypothetical protein